VLLPVSGVELVVREPTGHEELFVAETALDAPLAMLELARRVAAAEQSGTADWMALPAVDLDAVALIIRQTLIGEEIESDAVCPDPQCGERIEVCFRIGDYLAHHRPRRPRHVSPAAEIGWYQLEGTDVRFRIPTVADLLAAWRGASPDAALARRCVEPPEVRTAVARRIERALSALAPRLNDLVGGSCPACQQEVSLRFDPLTFTWNEVQRLCAGIHQQIHALAAAYGWDEETIVALPRRRRVRYASIIAGERSAA
jgi:hypothetical protein